MVLVLCDEMLAVSWLMTMVLFGEMSGRWSMQLRWDCRCYVMHSLTTLFLWILGFGYTFYGYGILWNISRVLPLLSGLGIGVVVSYGTMDPIRQRDPWI